MRFTLTAFEKGEIFETLETSCGRVNKTICNEMRFHFIKNYLSIFMAQSQNVHTNINQILFDIKKNDRQERKNFHITKICRLSFIM